MLDCHVRNVCFTNCHFAQIPRENIAGRLDGPYCADREFTLYPPFRRADHLVMNGTVFYVL